MTLAPLPLRRRSFALGAAGALAAPVTGGKAQVLRFIPEADLAVLDPVWTTANVTQTHGFLVFDTLYGFDESYTVQPQMVEGHTVSDSRTIWTIRLRPDLRFHDGERVTAADAVPSIRRWAARTPFGQALLAATDEIAAPDDRTIRLRLKHPFPVDRALANGPFIMPARLANTDPGTQIDAMVGSGPFVFLADERVAGSRVAYRRFDGYVPRPAGQPSFTAGPKIAQLDRVEWNVLPDVGTAAGAMQAGEADWWSSPSFDLLPKLRSVKDLAVQMVDLSGSVGIMRFNHLNPPFDKAAIRQAVLGVVQQSDFTVAVAGDDQSYWKTRVGAFALESPMASEEGLSALTGPRDPVKAKRDLAAAGYDGERVVLLCPGDLQNVMALSLVGADALRRAGMNVDLQMMDWGSLVQRRAKQEPVGRGGWSVTFTTLAGSGIMDPVGHLGLRADGKSAWVGWPTSPAIEALRADFVRTDDVTEQKRICQAIQAEFFKSVPYIPLGEVYTPYVFRKRVTGMRRGFPQFYGLSLSSA